MRGAVTRGKSVDVVWFRDEYAEYTPSPGARCFDMMGNPIEGKRVRLSESPIYVVSSSKG